MTERRRLLTGWTGAVTAVALGLAAALPATAAAPAGAVPAAAVPAVPPVAGAIPGYATTDADATITTRDGIVLIAKIYSPTGAPGKRPLIVLPSAWGGEAGQMAWSAKRLAARGFIVVNYATRGFKGSGGQVSMAGPKDVTDVSDLIDWSVANQPVDGTRVGMWGLSYGAGLSLLAAAGDPRIDAVGSLEGFTDLVRTAYPNRTRSTVLVGGLWFGAVIAGELEPELTTAFKAVVLGEGDLTTVLPYLSARSPINVIDRINQNAPAVFMATSWNDLAYGTDQISDFYSRLKGVKRLEVRPGDHVINEVPTSVGIGPPDLYDHMIDWMTTYVGGMDTPVAHQTSVWMQPRSSGPRPAPQTYPTWSSMTTGTTTYGLSPATGWFQPTGGVVAGPGGTWSQTIDQGLNVAQGLGAPIVGFAGESLTGTPPTNRLGMANRANTAVWTGARLTAPLVLRGQTTVTINVTPTRSSGTIVAYLYDSRGADGYLISHRPWSFRGATPGRPIQVTLPLQPTAYTLPAGHALSVGISSGDPLYANENPDGAKIGLSSTAAFPATVTISTGSAT